MAEPEEPEAGWYLTIQEAADAALAEDTVDVGGPPREVVILGRKRNPIHQYKVNLRPAE